MKLFKLYSKPQKELEGDRICIFSYGSGLQASMYSIKVRSDASDSLSKVLYGVSNVRKLLENRIKIEPESFTRAMSLREAVHHKGKEINMST